LLTGSIDYAGLFPPASLAMDDADDYLARLAPRPGTDGHDD